MADESARHLPRRRSLHHGFCSLAVVSMQKGREGSGPSVPVLTPSSSQTATPVGAGDPAATGSVRNPTAGAAETRTASSSLALAQLVAAADAKDPKAAFELAGRFREGRGVCA